MRMGRRQLRETEPPTLSSMKVMWMVKSMMLVRMAIWEKEPPTLSSKGCFVELIVALKVK